VLAIDRDALDPFIKEITTCRNGLHAARDIETEKGGKGYDRPTQPPPQGDPHNLSTAPESGRFRQPHGEHAERVDWWTLRRETRPRPDHHGAGTPVTRVVDAITVSGEEEGQVVMGWRKRWAAWVKLRRTRRARTRLTFQTCRRCGSYSLLPIIRERPLCGGCRSPR
jgi:hypothetical protein